MSKRVPRWKNPPPPPPKRTIKGEIEPERPEFPQDRNSEEKLYTISDVRHKFFIAFACGVIIGINLTHIIIKIARNS